MTFKEVSPRYATSVQLIKNAEIIPSFYHLLETENVLHILMSFRSTEFFFKKFYPRLVATNF